MGKVSRDVSFPVSLYDFLAQVKEMGVRIALAAIVLLVNFAIAPAA